MKDFFQKENAFIEQMTAWHRTKEGGWIPKRHDPSRFIWRDFNPLLLERDEDNNPGVVKWVSRLVSRGIIAKGNVRLTTSAVTYGDKDFVATGVVNDALSLNSQILSDLGKEWRVRISDSLDSTDQCVMAFGRFVQNLAVAEGEDENGAPYVYGGLSVKVDEIDQEIPFTVYMGKVMNIGDVAVEGLEVMLALVDGKGRIAEELSIYKVPEPVQPQSGFTYFADVTIKTIIDGDRIRGYFRAGEEEEWTVIKNSLDNDCAWELLLDDYYPKTLLDENTSVTYNKTENRLTVNTLAGTEVTLVSGVDGSNLTVVPAVDGEVSVDLSEYGVNVFVLQLRKGRQKVEVSLEF